MGSVLQSINRVFSSDVSRFTFHKLMPGLVLLLAIFFCHAARADYAATFIQSTCDSSANFFSFDSFTIDGGETTFDWKTNQSATFQDKAITTIQSMHEWSQHPIRCDFSFNNALGQHHREITVQAIQYTYGSSIQCNFHENATLEIILDGKKIFDERNMNGLCSFRANTIELTPDYLSLCQTPDLNWGNASTTNNNGPDYSFPKNRNVFLPLKETCQRYKLF
jgi:hypothetical protein